MMPRNCKTISYPLRFPLNRPDKRDPLTEGGFRFGRNRKDKSVENTKNEQQTTWKFVGMKLPEAMLQEIDATAKSKGLPRGRSIVLREAIADYLKRQSQQHPA